MTQAAQRALETIESLPRSDQEEVIAELLRRAALADHDAPSDTDLTALADELFRDLDRNETTR